MTDTGAACTVCDWKTSGPGSTYRASDHHERTGHDVKYWGKPISGELAAFFAPATLEHLTYAGTSPAIK